MREMRELPRLKYELGRSHREIAGSIGVVNSKVSDYVRRATAAGLSWPPPEGLEAALFPVPPPPRVARPEPDWRDLHRELQRHKGVTLRLLWLEYREAHPNGYQYSRFCERYRGWRGRLDVVMRQVHRAREKAFVDYAGPKFEVVDRSTGVRRAMVFSRPRPSPCPAAPVAAWSAPWCRSGWPAPGRWDSGPGRSGWLCAPPPSHCPGSPVREPCPRTGTSRRARPSSPAGRGFRSLPRTCGSSTPTAARRSVSN